MFATQSTYDPDSLTCFRYVSASRLFKSSSFTVSIRQQSACKTIWLIVLMLIGLAITFMLWCTDIIDQFVISKMVLTNSSQAFQYWLKPPVRPIVKVYVFNYTNVDKFRNYEDAKLKISETGPYVYEEIMERVNVKFDINGRISYQESRRYRYRNDLSSNVHEYDTIIAPNLPLLTAVAMSSNAYYMTKLAISAVLSSLNAKPFVQTPVHDYLWGYNDKLLSLTRTVLPAHYTGMTSNNFGILTKRKGISPHKFTIETGRNDYNKIGQMYKFNERFLMPYWHSYDCNDVYGTDGSKFPPETVRYRAPVYIFSADLCRKLQYRYAKSVRLFNNTIDAYHYVLPHDIFTYSNRNCYSDNLCYCDVSTNTCPPDGTFNTTVCTRGAPTLISFPYFYHGNKSLREQFWNFQIPSNQNFDSYLDLHPKFGFTMSARNNFQINIVAKQSEGFSQMNMFQNDMILPVAWIQVVFDEMTTPHDLYVTFYALSQTLPFVEAVLKYTSAIFTFCMFLIILVRFIHKL